MLLLWRSQIRFLIRHPLLAVLTVLGVALGVAVIHATDLTNRSAKTSLTEAHRELHGFARYRIVGSGQPIAENDYADLRRRWLAVHPDWRLLPVIAGNVDIGGEHWQLLGVDVSADLRFGAAHSSRDNNDAQPRHDRPLALIGSNAVLLSENSAAALGLQHDAEFSVSSTAGPQHLRVLTTFRDDRGLFPRLLVTDIGIAQSLLGLAGKLSYVELAGATDLTAADLDGLRRDLPTGLQLLDNQNIVAGQGALLDAFQFNLSALSTLALLVGCLLMFSAAQFAFWQRRVLLERLYWLGATPRQLLLNLLLESLLIAAVACAIGWLLGSALSRILLPLAAGTINELFSAQTIVHFGGSVWDYTKTGLLAAGALLGTQCFLFLTWRRDERITPASSSTQFGPGSTPRGRAYWLTIAALAALGVILLRLPGASLGAGFAAIFAISAAWLLLTPELYRAALNGLGRLRWPPLPTLALRDSHRHYRRLALALAALCLALAAGLGIDLMVDSFRRSLLDWLEQQVAADLYIREETPQAARDTALPAQLEQDARVTALSLTRRVTLEVNDRPVTLQAIAMPADAQEKYPLLAFSGHSRQDAWQDLQGDAVMIGEPLARKWQLAPGGRITLPTPAGPRVFRIAAVTRDYSTDYGRLIVSLDTYRRLWRDNTFDSIGVFVKNPEAIESLRQTLLGYSTTGDYSVTEGRRLKADIARLFERTFVITRLLQLLVSVVALAALISTLLIHQLMQKREQATLRALGLSRGGLLRLSLLQALPLGLAAGLLALPLGYALAWLLVEEINPRAFGWSLDFHIRADSALHTVLLALLLAALAALYPAWRSARLSVASELSRE